MTIRSGARTSITGSSGYLGGELARRGPDATGTYLTAPRPGAVRLDVRDADAVARSWPRRPAAVIHTAYSEAGDDDAREVNVDGRTSRARPRTSARGSCTSRPTLFRRHPRPPVHRGRRGAADHGVRPPEARGGGGGARGAAVRARRAHIADLRWRRAEPARTCGARCGGRRHGRALLQRRAAQPGAGGRPCLGAAGVGGVRGIRGVLHVAGADGVSRYGFARLVAAAGGRDPDALESALASEHPDPRPIDCRLNSSRARAREGIELRGVREVLGR